MDLNCPYCQTAFPKFPSRKTKCQACGQVVYPKRRIEDPEGVKVLLTEQQADEVENAWREQQALAQLSESLKPTGITLEQLRSYAATGATAEDVAYQGLKHCLHEFLIDDLNARAFAYHLLGNLAWKRNEKIEAVEFHRRAYLNTAKCIAARINQPKLALHLSPRACSECKNLPPNIDAGDYITQQLLPLANCKELASTRGAGCVTILVSFSHIT